MVHRCCLHCRSFYFSAASRELTDRRRLRGVRRRALVSACREVYTALRGKSAARPAAAVQALLGSLLRLITGLRLKPGILIAVITPSTSHWVLPGSGLLVGLIDELLPGSGAGAVRSYGPAHLQMARSSARWPGLCPVLLKQFVCYRSNALARRSSRVHRVRKQKRLGISTLQSRIQAGGEQLPLLLPGGRRHRVRHYYHALTLVTC